jgi:hypothetical protein
MRRLGTLFLVLAALACNGPAWAEARWENLPPTPSLPEPVRSGTAAVNGIKLWYAVFGQGEPVVLVHGGLGNSDY